MQLSHYRGYKRLVTLPVSSNFASQVKPTNYPHYHRLTMNILYVALLLCVICHVFASETGSSTTQVPGKVGSIEDSLDAQAFKSAIDGGKVGAARNIFDKGNNDQKEYYGKYLVSLKRGRLVRLIKNAGRATLGFEYHHVVCRRKIDQGGFGSSRPSSFNFFDECRKNERLACSPDRFINLLERITDETYQEGAVGFGARALFTTKRTECFDPLLAALKRSASLTQT